MLNLSGQFTAPQRIDAAPAAARVPADVERALQLLNKHIYQADRHTGMLIVLQHDDAKDPSSSPPAAIGTSAPAR